MYTVRSHSEMVFPELGKGRGIVLNNTDIEATKPLVLQPFQGNSRRPLLPCHRLAEKWSGRNVDLTPRGSGR